MKVDSYFPPGPPDTAARAARNAADVGFDGFFSAETAHDPFIPLAFAATAAPELDLGTAIAVAFPRSPMVVAQTAWDLARLSNGRFILGLGTQVKAHIRRRFSVEWTSAGARMREYILALRAIWHSFQTGDDLDYRSENYSFSLLTPFFRPEPMEHWRIPVAIAGVGPHLSRLAGEVCDGFHVHPFHTIEYLDRVVLPNIAAGAESSGRTLEDIDRISTVFVVTGRDEDEIAAAKDAVRMQIGFYASTPSYRIVLETEGWDFGSKLSSMSRRGEWAELGSVVPDEVVDAVAVVGHPSEIGPKIKARYGDRLQRVGYYALGGGTTLPDEELAAMVAATR